MTSHAPTHPRLDIFFYFTFANTGTNIESTDQLLAVEGFTKTNHRCSNGPNGKTIRR